MSQIKKNIEDRFDEIVHRKELDRHKVLILQQNDLRVKFCASCGHMLRENHKELDKHCKHRHQGQNLGFLVFGKEPKNPMYSNFEEWLVTKCIWLIRVTPYEFKKVEGVPIDPETKEEWREDQ